MIQGCKMKIFSYVIKVIKSSISEFIVNVKTEMEIRQKAALLESEVFCILHGYNGHKAVVNFSAPSEAAALKFAGQNENLVKMPSGKYWAKFA